MEFSSQSSRPSLTPVPGSGTPSSGSKPREALKASSLSYFELPRRLGRYVLLRRIAKGGMGEVMLAAALGLEGAERPCIVKTIRSEHRTDKSFRARFLDEARVQAQLEHPGVAQVLEATIDDETNEPYVVVEYVDGRSLGDVRARAISTSERIGWSEAVAIIQLTAEALSHVHDRADGDGKPLAIVHRDLSPQNLMVSYGGEIKIIDFGTARGENRRCHTVSGVVFAKPGYVAPEVANGNPGDFRVDLYAIGVMLWELVSGRRFLSGEASDHMALVAKGERELPPTAELNDAPPGLDIVIRRLTAFDKNHRYAHTKDAARELASLLSHAPTMASGERGVRGRVSTVMARLFKGETMRARKEFVRLVSEARKVFNTGKTPKAATPRIAAAVRASEQGLLGGTRYKLLTELGRGEVTTVHKATHVDLDRTVALKLLETKDVRGEAQLRTEMKVLPLVEGPGVVRLRDAGRTVDDKPFLVLDLCEGETLESLQRTKEVCISEALGLTERLLVILAEVHARGVIHRDVKPSNVIVGSSGELTLIDFGIALAKTEDDAPSSKPAEESTTKKVEPPKIELWGTPEYMAPEQAARPHEVDARADLYAVGTVLYELLTKSVPFKASTGFGVIQQKAQGSPEDVSSRVEGPVSPALDRFVGKALARHAALRFGSALEMLEELRAVIREPETRRQRTKRAAVFATIAAVLGAGLFAGATLTDGGREAAGEAQGIWSTHVLSGDSANAQPSIGPSLEELAPAARANEPVKAETEVPTPTTPTPVAWTEPPFDPKSAFIGPKLVGQADVAADESPAVTSTKKPKEKKKTRRAETKKKPDDKRGKKKAQAR